MVSTLRRSCAIGGQNGGSSPERAVLDDDAQRVMAQEEPPSRPDFAVADRLALSMALTS
jgi:hypothetical protein